MKIAVIGSGYVGLSTGIVLAYLGHAVTGIDIDESRVSELQAGMLPIFEPGLSDLMKAAGPRLAWSLDYEAAQDADVIFIAVGTPSRADGMPDLSYLESAARGVAGILPENRLVVIVNKSTVPIGSADLVTRLIRDGNASADFLVVSNPEFLREGTAILDNLYPDRIVLGSSDNRALEVMRKVYAPIAEQSFAPPSAAPRPERYVGPAFVTTDPVSAELIKYAANTFLAMKISFANEVSTLCEDVGADITEVMRGIGHDQRIGARFLSAGAGWGGSCFGKDTRALVAMASEYGHRMPLTEATITVNSEARSRIVVKLQHQLKLLKGKTIAVLGLAFKPNTDDLRDAPAFDVIRRLLELGARVKAHDPVAVPRARSSWPELDVTYCSTAFQAATGADAVILMTEWPEYRELAWDDLKALMLSPNIVDARNYWDPAALNAHGFMYEGVGR